MVLNTRLIFDTDVKKDKNSTLEYPALAGASGYFDYSGAPVGNVAIGYSLGGFSSGITLYQGGLASDYGAESWATMEGEGYKFQVSGNLSDVVNKNATIGRLWGYYKLLGGMIHLETAFNSDDTAFWKSDVTGAFGGSRGDGFDDLGSLYGDGDVFASFDHHNYIVANVSVANLEFGIVLPNLFHNMFVADNAKVYGRKGGAFPWDPFNPLTDSLNGGPGGGNTLDPQFVENGGLGHWSGNDRGYVRLTDHVLKMTIVGVKFDLNPLEVAAQFLMQDYQIYLGGKYNIGPATIGLSFMGMMGNDDYRVMKAGLSFGMDSGSYGWSLRGKLFNGSNLKGNDAGTIISIEPNFFYNAIPTHLCFNINAGFYFDTETDGAGEKQPMDTYWGFQPEIFWNFLGTGAGHDFYWPLSTGMIIRYRMYSGEIVNNSLDVTFKFTF
jgi:hypothetical protein